MPTRGSQCIAMIDLQLASNVDNVIRNCDGYMLKLRGIRVLLAGCDSFRRLIRYA